MPVFMHRNHLCAGVRFLAETSNFKNRTLGKDVLLIITLVNNVLRNFEVMFLPRNKLYLRSGHY